jgi:outer membrane protein OmpA-like peptidoglycan-associated protein
MVTHLWDTKEEIVIMAKTVKALIHEEEDPFGPGIDLVVALLIFFLLMLVAIASMYKVSEDKRKKQETYIAEYKTDVDSSKSKIDSLMKENQDLKDRLEEIRKNLGEKFPPNIVLAASDGLEFDPGKAVLSPKLDGYVRNQLVKQIEEAVRQYNVNTVVVIGHTDGQNVRQQMSNLDTQVEGIMKGDKPVDTLIPGSNTDLGMMRALAVIATLRNIQKTSGQMTKIDASNGFRAYSAGPFLTKEGTLAPMGNINDPKRRRIEIRFIRRPEPETPLVLDE